MGFGYDRVRDDYKVIRNAMEWIRCGIEDTESNESIWELYSLRTDSWRKLDVDIPLGSVTLGATLHTNGVCHWWNRDEDCLVSFDLSCEVFYKTPLPLQVDGNFYCESKDKRFMTLNGYVAFITTYATNYGSITSTLYISILGEYGMKESWTKLFIVESLPSYIDRPIGAGNKVIQEDSNHKIVGPIDDSSIFVNVAHRQNFKSRDTTKPCGEIEVASSTSNNDPISCSNK
ncbi:hypothetical protein KIW84_013472 [Lathyrus oleraceus]|uniref:F-box associated beta-propeller type 1 domain-containing protein n=1 Tax=Pisum sativum TaxID=3888 RepID=A0A9D5GY26_PEA|nr:hypothetical protein KIW84_013472 [Pisum sativum]